MRFLFISDGGAKKGAKKKGSSFQTVSALFRVKYKFRLGKKVYSVSMYYICAI
jgi:hypothetical protein